MYRVWNFLANYSLLLIFGALIALVWANTNPHSYHHLVEYPLWFNDWLGPSYKYWARKGCTRQQQLDGVKVWYPRKWLVPGIVKRWFDYYNGK